MKKILTVFGTRPEAIKLAPILLKMREDKEIYSVVCASGQHRDMLNSVLEEFEIVPDFDLSIMRDGQSLSYITEAVISGVDKVILDVCPDILLVHGDTTTAYAAALSAFYRRIPIGHVEAGLRSGDVTSPFPEEFNRRSISSMADYHFCPTTDATKNLLNEGIEKSKIFLVGNTAVDALLLKKNSDIKFSIARKYIILTVHRREHSDDELKDIFKAVRRISTNHEDIDIIFPVHKNPRIRRIAQEIFGGYRNIKMTEPMRVGEFHSLLRKSFFIISDSGGIQEEAAFLGKPLLLVRENTERPEASRCGVVKVVGENSEAIFYAAEKLISDTAEYGKMSNPSLCFGDGTASEKIISILKNI